MSDHAGARNVPLWTAIVASIFAFVTCAIHVWMHPLPGLVALEGLTIDARFKVRGPRPAASDRVVVVGLDDETRRTAPDVFQTRRGWARLIRALSQYDVKVIALDLFYSAPEVILPTTLANEVRATVRDLAASPITDDDRAAKLAALIHEVGDELRGDELLAAAIADSHRVFLGAFMRQGDGAPRERDPEMLRLARHGEVADGGTGGARRPLHANGVDFTLDTIAKGAIGAGVINNIVDSDGVVRRLPLAFAYGHQHYMPLGLAVALYDLGKSGDTKYLVGDRMLDAAGRRLPLGASASMALDVLGRDRLPRVSAAAVLAGTAPASALKDKLVFVGMTYSTTDKVHTPLDNLADGVELHATLAENVLSGHMLSSAGAGSTLLAMLALSGIVIAAQVRRIRRRAWVPPLVALGALAVYLGLAQLAFTDGTIVTIAAPCLLATLVLAAATIGGLATEGREKAHLRAVFSQYVSRTVVDRILADPARAKLGGERKELTVLFSDIRGFSALAEGMGPEALASFLGEYLTPMTELVLESGGTLDKYIGDAVMAIWAAPVDVPDHAARACEVALRMQEALAALNRRWQADGKPTIAIGIGINTGAMSVGNMGTPQRFDYTVLGDQVNLGARLEALTKEYGVDILVGAATANAAGPTFVFREVDVVRVKGRAGAAPVFELVGRVGAATDSRFAEALTAYRRRDFAAARSLFSALTDDATAAVMARRCADLAASPPGEDWDGVYEQRSK